MVSTQSDTEFNVTVHFIRWSTQNLYITAYKNLVLALLLTAVVFLFGIDRTEPPVRNTDMCMCIVHSIQCVYSM